MICYRVYRTCQDICRCQSSWPWSSERWPGRDVANACRVTSCHVVSCDVYFGAFFKWFLVILMILSVCHLKQVHRALHQACQVTVSVHWSPKQCQVWRWNARTVRAISFDIFWQSLTVALCTSWVLPSGGDSLSQTLWCLHWMTNPQIFVHRSRDRSTLKQPYT